MFRHFLEWHDRQHESLNDLAIIQMVALFVNGHLGTNMFEDRAWPDGVERALAYIHNALEQDPSAKISTADIATFIFVSQPHLCRLFRAHLGNTPADIVRFAKLDIATGLLVRSNYKISEISDHCGFANQYHFARIFKQAYGRTPSEVRLSSKSGRGVPLSRLVSLSAKTPSD
jgi:transcriptional regulator GlxA family with amidase domain